MLKSRLGIKKIAENRAITVCVGTICSLSSLIAACAAASFFLMLTENPSEFTGLGALVSILVSGAASGFLISHIAGKDGFITSIISLAVASSVMLIFSAFFGGVGLSAFMNALSFFGIGTLSAFLGKKRTKTHKHIKRHR